MEIKAVYRERRGTSASKKLRVAGLIPAVVYGAKTSFCVSVNEKDAKKLINSIGESYQQVSLIVDNDKKEEKIQVIIQDHQRSNIKNKLLHIDFREVNQDTALRINLPINIIGVAQGVKLGGVMQIIRREIPVVCKVKDLVDQIDVDVSELSFGGSIHVLDIPYPNGIKPIVTGRNFTLITLSGKSAEIEVATDEEIESSEA